MSEQGRSEITEWTINLCPHGERQAHGVSGGPDAFWCPGPVDESSVQQFGPPIEPTP